MRLLLITLLATGALAQGREGRMGANGAQGLQGTAGATGATGAQGPQGDAGTVFSTVADGGVLLINGVLTCEAASATTRGCLRIDTATFTGALAASNLSGTNTGDVTYSSVADGGVVVTGTTIACAAASKTGTGCVDTGPQTFAGAKIFDGGVNTGTLFIDGVATMSGAILSINENLAANSFYCANSSACTRTLQFTSGSNTWAFTGATPVLKISSLFVPVTPGQTQLIQHGTAAATAGTLAVTFPTAYAAAPDCVCTAVSGVAPCIISVGATTTTISFNVLLGGTTAITWQCIGNR